MTLPIDYTIHDIIHRYSNCGVDRDRDIARVGNLMQIGENI